MKENWEINWKDYYKTLQVDTEAEPEIIKGAFERLARKYHPDLNNNSDATQRMTEINEAYGILGDAEKRKNYNTAYLQRKNSSTESSPSPQYSPHPPSSTSPPPYSSSPRPRSNTRSSSFNSVCQRCGKSKRVAFAHYNKNIGLGFSRREQSIKGYFCAKCVRVLFLQYFFTCFALGWFGIVSLVTNPFRMIFDVFQYIRAEIRLGGFGKAVTYSCLAGILVLCSLLAFRSRDSSGSSANSTAESGGMLYSITISPASVNLSGGSTQQFVARGNYSDGSTADVSSLVTWASSNSAVATISSTGFAICGAVGATRITASLNGITSASASITILASASKTITEPITTTTQTNSSAIAYLTLNPTSGNQGTVIDVQGYNFTPNATVSPNYIIFSDSISTGSTLNVDSSGSLSFTYYISSTTPQGTYTMYVQDSSGKYASASFTVN
jgi:hypothetical protein